MKRKIWQQGAVYQIYPRSFCDSNGDGIGDIQGIISKLDYLRDLGVKMIWLSPIYQSPLDDMGYDISSYYDILPEYGTMEDFDQLIEEANKRGLKIIMDLVANHTSDEHEWFQKSKDPSSPYHQYYYWRKGKGEGIPPNNWTAMFTGPAWEYCPENDLWYLHLYSKKQPDLDWHNPAVVEEIEKILRFYLDKGVYGFRCDVINQIYKESLEDGRGHSEQARGIEHYLNSDGCHRLLRKLYDDVFSHYDDCVVIGETYKIDPENGRRYLQNHELDMFFQFDHMAVDALFLPVFHRKFKPARLKNILFSWQKEVSWNANYLENHDQLRSTSRFGSPLFPKESAKALGMLNLFLSGTPFIYQGEEIGMTNYPDFDPEKSLDVSCRNVYHLIRTKFRIFPKKTAKKFADRINRDHARTPMQWDQTLNGGFSTGSPWLPVNPNYKEINAKEEINDPDSIYSFYQKALHLRESEETLFAGQFEAISTKGDLIAYSRTYEGKTIHVLINLGKKRRKIPSALNPQGKEILLSTYSDSNPSPYLRPYEGILFR